jgi:hypothetical protein
VQIGQTQEVVALVRPATRCQRPSRKSPREILRRIALSTVLFFAAAVAASGQSNTPIISGGIQYENATAGGATAFAPVISPVVTIPIGDRWLIESRASFEELIFRENGTSGPYHSVTFSSVDYFQLDYLINSHVTLVVGDFLTPFNIYNERIAPIWIHNFNDAPLIAGIGTRTSGSSEGAQLRGVAVAHKNWELNYSAYFSTLVNAHQFASGRTAGGRIGVFAPNTRLEVGLSYQRFLQDLHLNSIGTYVVWQPQSTPLEVRAEYAHSRGGQGYWLEGAYRLSHLRGPDSWIGRLQPIARVQQFYIGTPSPGDANAPVDTQRIDFGFNYYLPHNIRANASYGRQFSSLGNVNVWELQLTYRFLFPLIPGGSK